MSRNISSLPGDFERDMREFSHLVKEELPDFIESELREVVSDSFEAEQWKGGNGKKWQARKNDKESSKSRNERRALLVGSGDLIKSYDTERSGDEISIGSDLIYAEVHNEGKRAGRDKGFQMPQRQHAPIPGEAIPKLEEATDKFMDKRTDQIFNK